jgi:phospholipase/lecithinase/hemolysin
MNPIFSQSLKALCAITALAVLSACGGASSTVNPLHPTRIIAFGDGLSDVGTGSVTGLGGRFTINGSDTVAAATTTLATPTTVSEVLAGVYGLWSAALPPVARTIGDTTSLPATGLVSYAKGNAMIRKADAATVTGSLGGNEPTLMAQVQDYLARVNNKVATDDLIVITAGTRDLFSIAYRYFGRNATMLAADGTTSINIDSTLVTQLGGSLADKTAAFAELDRVVNGSNGLMASIDLLVQAGATHVLVVEPMNLARTPWGLSLDGSSSSADGKSKNFLWSLSYDTDEACLKTNPNNSFHCKLTVALMDKYKTDVDSRRVLHVDLAQQLNLWSGTTETGNLSTSLSYGVLSPKIPACAVTALTPTVTTTGYDATNFRYSTGCTVNASSAIWTDTTFNSYLFADNLNLTPLGNTLIANYIYNTKFYQAAWR